MPVLYWQMVRFLGVIVSSAFDLIRRDGMSYCGFRAFILESGS